MFHVRGFLCHEDDGGRGQVIRGLYAITDRNLSLGRDILFCTEEALKGGASIIQYREKNISTGEMVRAAKSLRELTLKYNATLIVNDRVDVAMASNADGVHLGQSDMEVLDARRILGTDAIIGLSVSSLHELEAAIELPVDYIGAGPVYATGSKADANEPMGLDLLHDICVKSPFPVVAIGGICKVTAPKVIAAGAASIAVISAVMSEVDIQKAARKLAGYY